ncbi:MAG: hypothetical protein ACREB3_10985, partial [Burkholderiales bacterium]
MQVVDFGGDARFRDLAVKLVGGFRSSGKRREPGAGKNTKAVPPQFVNRACQASFCSFKSESFISSPGPGPA